MSSEITYDRYVLLKKKKRKNNLKHENPLVDGNHIVGMEGMGKKLLFFLILFMMTKLYLCAFNGQYIS